MSQNNPTSINTHFFVSSKDIKNYKIFDKRCIKPRIIKDNDESLILEFLDIINIDKSNHSISYIQPNPIALQLNMVEQSIEMMKEMHIEKNLIYKESDYKNSDTSANYHNTTLIYQYISLAQQALVFSYTALETFANLSIPENYILVEEGKGSQEGITKTFNKQAIERQIELKRKFKEILPNIYSTKPIHLEKFWNDFCQLEKYRDQIIHQKSINRTVMYREYFNINIYKYLNVSNKIISFFKKEAKLNNKDNLLWPWLPDESPEDIPYIDDAMSILKGAKVTQRRI